MNAIRPTVIAALLAATGLVSPVWAGGRDDAMLKRANSSGCMTCHPIESGAKGPDGMAPIGPAWREVALKYQGQAGVEAKLTQTVLAGSDPFRGHWSGKVAGLAMPPNAVAISEADARRLVKWILALGPKP